MSNLFNLNLKDLVKGAFTTVIGAILTGVYAIIQSGGSFSVATLKPIAVGGVVAGLSYLGKNLLTNSQGQVLTPEPMDIVPGDPGHK